MPKKKTVQRKAATKTTGTKKSTRTTKSTRSGASVKVKANDANTCKHPTTLFEVEFPTTVLFWAGVALFFLFILLVARTI